MRPVRDNFAYPKPSLRLNLSRLNEFKRSVFRWGHQPSSGDTIVDAGAGWAKRR